MDELLQAEPGSLTATRAHVRLLAAKGLRDRINSVLNDPRFLKKGLG